MWEYAHVYMNSNLAAQRVKRVDKSEFRGLINSGCILKASAYTRIW